MLPIKLYRETDGKSDEVIGDVRTRLLNDDTGDTLDAVQFWKAVIRDYFLGGAGYVYIKKDRNYTIRKARWVHMGQTDN
jgi:phage portal protein BeeE